MFLAHFTLAIPGVGMGQAYLSHCWVFVLIRNRFRDASKSPRVTQQARIREKVSGLWPTAPAPVPGGLAAYPTNRSVELSRLSSWAFLKMKSQSQRFQNIPPALGPPFRIILFP